MKSNALVQQVLARLSQPGPAGIQGAAPPSEAVETAGVSLIPKKPVTPVTVVTDIVPPILAGWLITYINQAGKLCGGSIDRAHGTVQECRWDAGRWTVCLTDGQRVSIAAIRAVGQTNSLGQLLAAWEVRHHGYDGNNGEADL